MRIDRAGATALVVVHSRSGYTAEVALAIAQELRADYLRLSVPAGSGNGFFSTPNRHAEVGHSPSSVDLAAYSLVLVGSPIWYWHPSAFIYSFCRNLDLSGKRVVLFYTYEGGISRHALDDWKTLIANRGGIVAGVLGIDRMELEGQSLAAAATRIVREHAAEWRASTVPERDR
ncbi:MAG: hypothetical protein HYV63_28895 [Candidatus Schekmanbacteria bacterium]|nr:hypothetical protein [Candidatus Schekmanbacteria bacterium]